MHDNVFKALWRFLYQFKVQPNPLRIDIAGAPLGLHPLDAPSRKFNAERICPCCHQRRSAGAQLTAIPVLEHAFFRRLIAARPDVQVQRPAVADVNSTRGRTFDSVKTVALAEKEMALTR